MTGNGKGAQMSDADREKRHKLMAHMDRRGEIVPGTSLAMGGDLISRPAEDVMYDLGVRFAHSSGDHGLPDVGMSIGLGGAMLYAGEVPGKDRPGWWLAIYPKDGAREDIGQLENMKADTLMDALSAAIRSPTTDDMIPRAEADAMVAGAREAAKEAVANLPTGASEDVMEGQERAYRALEALTPADARAELDRLIADKVAEATGPLVKAATALRDQIKNWNDGGPAATPEESRALFDALDDALKGVSE